MFWKPFPTAQSRKVLEFSSTLKEVVWKGFFFLMLFGCPRKNLNHHPENLEVIYITHFVFYARINYQFKTSERKNIEILVEQTVQAFLCFSETCELWSSKAAFTIVCFDNYRSKSSNHKQWHFKPFEVNLFPKKSTKMIDGSEKHKHQLAFELQNLRVFEKRSKVLLAWTWNVLLCTNLWLTLLVGGPWKSNGFLEKSLNMAAIFGMNPG